MAVPTYERARSQTALMGLSIGYVLVIVRDFTKRGTLARLKEGELFGKSVSTLNRCMRLAQKFIEAKKLTDAEGKLANTEGALALFQTGVDFNEKALSKPFLADMSAWVGDYSMRDLLDSDLLGEDEAETPNGHQKNTAAKRTKDSATTLKREAFAKAFKGLHASFFAHEWKCLYQRKDPDTKPGDDVGLLDLEESLDEMLKAVREHNKQAAQSLRVKKPAKKAAKTKA